MRRKSKLAKNSLGNEYRSSAKQQSEAKEEKTFSRSQLICLVHTSLLGDHSEREPPDPIPNSEVKPLSADDSVAVCHVKVGNCQALKNEPKFNHLGFFLPKNWARHAMRSTLRAQN